MTSHAPEYHQHEEFRNRSAKLAEIRKIGIDPYPHTYAPTHTLHQLTEKYERFRKDGKLPATFEVVYGHAWKPAARPKTKIDLGAGFAPVTFHGKK